MSKFNIDLNGTIVRNCNKINAVNINNGQMIEFSSKAKLDNYLTKTLTELDSDDFGNVTEIPQNTFSIQTQLKKVTLPNTVNSIQHDAFLGCAILNEINLANIKYIDFNAFSHTNIEDIKDLYPLDKTIPNSCFEYTNIQNLKIHDGITTIENDAFNQSPLKTIILPSSIKTIMELGCYGYKPANWIRIESCIPPVIEENSFHIDDNTILIIPNGTRHLYENATNYAAFQNIEEYEPETNITYTFNVIGGTLLEDENSVSTKMPIYEAPRCISDDNKKIFLGWYVNDEPISFPYINKTDVTLTAKFGYADGSSKLLAIDVSDNIGLTFSGTTGTNKVATQITITQYFNKNQIHVVSNGNHSGKFEDIKWYKITPEYSGKYNFTLTNYYCELLIYDSIDATNYIDYISTYNSLSTYKTISLTKGNTYYFVCGSVEGVQQLHYLTIDCTITSQDTIDDIDSGLLQIEDIPDRLSLTIYGVADDNNSYILLNNITDGLYNINSRFSTLSYLHGYTFSNKNIFMKLNLPNNYPEGNIPNVSVRSYYPNQNAAATEDDIETIFAQDDSNNWYIFDNDNSGFSFDSAGYGYKVEFTEKTFTVTYTAIENSQDYTNAAPIDNTQYNYYDQATVLFTNTPTSNLEGYSFYGYYRLNANGNDIVHGIDIFTEDGENSFDIVEDVTLYPLFKYTDNGAEVLIDPINNRSYIIPPTYTVTYDLGDYGEGEVPVDNNRYHAGDMVTVLFDPAPVCTHISKESGEAFTFVGWTTRSTNQHVWGPRYTQNGTNTFIIDKDTTLYATCNAGNTTEEQKNCSVTYTSIDNLFDYGGDSPVDINTYYMYDYAPVLYTPHPIYSSGQVMPGSRYQEFYGWTTTIMNKNRILTEKNNEYIEVGSQDITLYPIMAIIHNNEIEQLYEPYNGNLYYTVNYVSIENNADYTNDAPIDDILYSSNDNTVNVLFNNTPTCNLEGYEFYGYRLGNSDWNTILTNTNKTFNISSCVNLYPIFTYSYNTNWHLFDPINNEDFIIQSHSGGSVN